MAMLHDANGAPSYEHMMGSEQRSHLGSQSQSPTPAKSGHPMTKTKGGTQKAHKIP